MDFDNPSNMILNALGSVVLVITPDGLISFVNNAAEQFLGGSAAQLCRQRLDRVIPPDSPLNSLVKQVQDNAISVSEYGLTLDTPRISKQLINVQLSPLPDQPGYVVISIFARSIADKIDRQLVHRNAARSVSAMAAMLAHEVKNPLSGIRGAAQLLEQVATAEDKKLTRLIVDETDRICALVDRIEIFSDQRPIERASVNIHQVLERVRQLAKTGFAKHIHIIENYDPSLPHVDGNHDQLVQIFLNLVKNAAEAAPKSGGEIVLKTSYQHSVRFAVPGAVTRTHLPLLVAIEDNGDGIPDDLVDHLFDAFVTSKPKGTGLGLALVAKMVDDHGGVVEFDTQPGKTIFRVMLPIEAPNSGEPK